MIRFLLLTAAAAAAGVAQFASYQPTGLWWAAPLGFALFFYAVHRAVESAADARHIRRWAMWLGWVQGLVCYLFLLPWVGEYVGAIAWIGLALLESLYSLLFGLGLGLICVAVRGRQRGRGLTLLVLLGVPAWFVAAEWLRSTWPFGGFGWGRVAWGQITGPLAQWVSVAGPALVTYAVVVSGLALAMLLQRRYVTVASTLAVTLGGGLVLSLIPTSWGGTVGGDDETLNVVAVQGNVPRLGLDFNSQRSAVLNNHLTQTHRLAEEIDAGERPRPDLVIWPENASDINPFTDPAVADEITAAARAVGAPLLVGTITRDEEGARNTAVVWDPETGAGDQHVKKFLQPFGEYMPYRDLLRHVSPYVDMAGDFKAGDGDGVVEMDDVPVGVATCYEASFDGAYRDAVRAGATLFASPTNNATFGFTDMTFQQLAINRMRAIEYDRSVIVAATSGVSAIVDPDGSVTDRTEIFRAGLLQEDVPVRDTETLSARIGPFGEWLIALAGAGVVLYAGFRQKNKTQKYHKTQKNQKNQKKR